MARALPQPILDSLLAACRETYGPRLVTVGVFGSVGRLSMHCHSDMVTLLIARPLPSGRMKRMDEFEQVEMRMDATLREASECGWAATLSPVVKSPEEVHQGSLLFLDMTEDLMLLFDSDRFFEHHLEGLRRRLERLGARRIRRGSSWYWDLKPDYTPGDVIEL